MGRPELQEAVGGERPFRRRHEPASVWGSVGAASWRWRSQPRPNECASWRAYDRSRGCIPYRNSGSRHGSERTVHSGPDAQDARLRPRRHRQGASRYRQRVGRNRQRRWCGIAPGLEGHSPVRHADGPDDSRGASAGRTSRARQVACGPVQLRSWCAEIFQRSGITSRAALPPACPSWSAGSQAALPERLRSAARKIPLRRSRLRSVRASVPVP